MTAGYVQFDPGYLDVDGNLEQVDGLLQSADVDLLVLPELFTSGYFFQSKEDLASVAEPIPEGETTQTLLSWSSNLDATIVAGLPEQSGDDFFNSAVVARPDGKTHLYRKTHLFYEENALFEPGDLGFPVFEIETRGGEAFTLGVMVCFDWYFPEAARSLALKGADIIAHPSNLVLPHCPESMPIRARENHVYTITANRYGSEKKGEETLTFIGMSEICDPSGEILSQAGQTETVLDTVEIDPETARQKAINEYNHVINDRRPDVYAVEKS